MESVNSTLQTKMYKFCGEEFLDISKLLNQSVPNASQCFQHTFLIWVPTCFLILFTPLQLLWIITSKEKRLEFTKLAIAKITALLVLVVVTLSQLVYSFSNLDTEKYWHLVWVIYPAMLCGAMVVLTVLYILNLRKGVHTSGLLFLTFLLFSLFAIPELRYWIGELVEKTDYDHFFLGTFFVYYIFLIISLVLHCFADQIKLDKDVDISKVSPEMKASFFNKLIFWWFNPLVINGYKHSLEMEELWMLNNQDATKSQVPSWEREWVPAMQSYKLKKAAHDEKMQSFKVHSVKGHEEVHILSGTPRGGPKPPPTPSIIYALWKVYKWKFLTAVVLKMCYDGMQFVNPQLLKLVIRFVSDPSLPLWLGLFYALGMFAVAMFSTLILQQFFHIMMSTGMNIRTILVAAVFNKSLNLSNGVRKERTVGEIVNLMSVDAQRFQDLANYINMVWSAPLQIILSMVFLWNLLGPSVLAGVAVMVLMIPLNFFIAKKQQAYQVSQMKFKDDRVKLMNEVLNGMKVLKLYAWEPSFEKMIHDIRKEELRVLRTSAYLSAVTGFTWMCAPFLVAVATFAAYVLTDENNILTPETAFVSLSLFNILRFPMSMLPMLISFVVQTQVSNKRLKDFFASDELDPKSVTKKAKAVEGEPVVSVHNATFTWDRSADDQDSNTVLRNVSMKVDQGALVALVGTVGSGKSSMLNALLGEMDVVEGNVTLSGSVSYVPQQAWIQNMSLRHNITFMKDFDQQWYDTVVDACALRPDFDILPGGDTTEIGEKGINLSGGQKQRVSLARAVYQNTDIYLLDDPLSAVDSHVGKHIFDKVIGPQGLLKDKTVLMVTNGLNYLKHCHQILVLTNGAISEMGTYEQLMENRGAFAEFLETHLIEEVMQKEKEGSPKTMQEELNIMEELEKYDPAARVRLESHLSSISAGGTPEKEHGDQVPNKIVSGSAASRFERVSRSLSASPPASPVLDEEFSPQPSNGYTARSDTSFYQAINRSNVKRTLESFTKKGDQIDKDIEDKTKLINKETAETGGVKVTVYLDYIRAIGYFVTLSYLFIFMLSTGFSVGSNIWLADWSDDSIHLLHNESMKIDTSARLGVYAALGFGQGIAVFIASMFMAFGMVLASLRLHATLINNLMRSPMSFYDVTPLGRILNRCGKDVNAVDNVLPQTIRSWVMCVFSVLATLTVIIISTPIFAVVIVPLSIIYVLVLRFYVSTSRQLKRLESVTRSPIYSHFQEAIQGASSIRAYGVVPRFIVESHNRIDTNIITYYPNITSNRWLAVRLEFVGNCIVLFAALFAVIYKGDGVTAGLVGLSVSYALSITQTLNWAVRMTSELESNIVAVERIKEYSETPREANWTSASENAPPDAWPEKGEVIIEHYATRYRDGLDLVLKGVSGRIKPEEKVGIVGRTGAGKSSLTLALFRIIEPSGGKIVIDGRDITQMGLHELRSKLTIIPQDPVLFSGTLRMNLDPFDKYSDAELWTALEHAHLKEFVQGFNSALLYPVSEGGENLSVGQRQLVCLARALLRKTKVLILDEATAAVDMETDQLIQNTIKTEFSDCTIITIAHRLNTILDADRILVLDKGLIAEFESPNKLLIDKNSIFFGMARDAGIVS